ncbi:hypothetical protein F4805DRAFT_440707 [Annulohypoxylon moriforme]|nr:hypothetical protein F4805DRAFT_440707 [Annulohypoxylon moriforme]
MSHAKVQDLTSKYDGLQELYKNDVKLKISSLEEAKESRERNLQQRLTIKGREAKDLRQEINSLKATFENAMAEKEEVQKTLAIDNERYKLQALQEQKRLDDVVKLWDESLAESEKLRQSLEELEKSTKPFDQTVVICVDVSGSLAGVFHDVKQAYRDVLHIIKSNNSEARVAVVVHGSYIQQEPSPIQEISDATFRIVESIPCASGSEDYTYCLEQAHVILRTKEDSKKLIILIGDGDALCSSTSALLETCKRLKSAGIRAHSIIIPSRSGSYLCAGTETMRSISEAVDGDIEYKDTYLPAFEKLLLQERGRCSKGS